MLLGAMFVPGLNFWLYSGHGGFGWLLLPLVCPFAVVVLISYALRSTRRTRAAFHAGGVLLSYLVLAFPLSRFAGSALESGFGLPANVYEFAAFPFSLAVARLLAR